MVHECVDKFASPTNRDIMFVVPDRECHARDMGVDTDHREE